MVHNKFLHDHLFKEVYSQPRYFLDILTILFSKKELGFLDLSTVHSETTSIVDKDFKEKRMDLLLSVQLKNSKKNARILFLMEHKSQKDPKLFRQFLMYQADMYQQTKDPIYPVLVNQSPKIWDGPLSFQDTLNNFEGELKKCFEDNVLNFRPRVLNISALDIDNQAKSLTTRPILYILKHIWQLDESKVRELFTMGQGLSEQDQKALILRAMDYVRRYDPRFTWNVIQELETQAIGKEKPIMTPILQSSLDEARQQGMQKGMQKGMQQGMQQGMQTGMQNVALSMLNKNLDFSLISEVTGLSIQQIKKFQIDNKK